MTLKTGGMGAPQWGLGTLALETWEFGRRSLSSATSHREVTQRSPCGAGKSRLLGIWRYNWEVIQIKGRLGSHLKWSQCWNHNRTFAGAGFPCKCENKPRTESEESTGNPTCEFLWLSMEKKR
jgi:hypothetical protein